MAKIYILSYPSLIIILGLSQNPSGFLVWFCDFENPLSFGILENAQGFANP
ncbi:MAG TPA: hypothetical protein VJK03_01990 [Candidatus Nanoarchaeia archaeon]|nr:hypothetical protein [Candidatus Nanoarchaeia archaeon]